MNPMNTPLNTRYCISNCVLWIDNSEPHENWCLKNIDIETTVYIYVFKCPSENHDMNYSYTLNMSKDSKHCNKQEHHMQFGNPVTVTLCVKLFQHVIRIECKKKIHI